MQNFRDFLNNDYLCEKDVDKFDQCDPVLLKFLNQIGRVTVQQHGTRKIGVITYELFSTLIDVDFKGVKGQISICVVNDTDTGDWYIGDGTQFKNLTVKYIDDLNKFVKDILVKIQKFSRY